MKSPITPQSRFSYATIITCLLAATALAVELFLTSQGKSLCHTTACEIVARYVRFGEPALLAAGACFFLALAGAVFFGRRYSNRTLVAFLPILLLTGAASFDGALIGFQFMTLGQKCTICLLVAAAIILVAILHAATLRKWTVAILCIAAWGAGFLANSVLIMPDVATNNARMFFYERPPAKQIKNPATATLIISLTCPHCTDVLKYLADQNHDTMRWRFAIIDRQPNIVGKLAYFFEHIAESDNPFQLLMDTKDQVSSSSARIPDTMPAMTHSARVFLANNGLKGIPVLVIDSPHDRITLVSGSKTIVNYLSQ